jgi:hypothetical protein
VVLSWEKLFFSWEKLGTFSNGFQAVTKINGKFVGITFFFVGITWEKVGGIWGELGNKPMGLLIGITAFLMQMLIFS